MAFAYYNYILSSYEARQRRKIERHLIRDVCNPFVIPDAEFQAIWRINKPMAFYLIERLKEDLQPIQLPGLPIHLKVLSAIQVLANGGYQRQVGQDHSLCLGQTTVSKFLDQFLEALYTKLFAEWVHFPGSEAARCAIADGFEEKYCIPGVIGLIDCTHIKIFPPSGPQGAQYKNKRKGAHTINVQLISDSQCRIISVNARYPGRVHDAFIWHHSNVRQELKRLHDRGITQYFLLGDSGYPLEPWLMTPIINPDADSPEHKYTEWHCKVRNGIERTNGYLKGTFRCLGVDRALHYAPEKASSIIYACCILYNLMKHFRVQLEPTEIVNEDFNANEMVEQGNILRQSRARRAQIISQHFTD